MVTAPIIEALCLLSNSKDKWTAIAEWESKSIFYIDAGNEPTTCTCGHYPIREVHTVVNKVNGNKCIVGNCCIKLLGDHTYNKAFKAIKDGRLNPKLIEVANSMGLLTAWELEFANNVCKRRCLSPKQELCYNKIVEKIMKAVKK